jgi:invasion protein IalB
MLVPITIAAGLLLATPIVSYAQPAASIAEREPAINKLVQDWNTARNNADVEAMVALFYPQDQALAREFYKDLKRGSANIRLVSVRPINQDRLSAVTERSWGGSSPGKAPVTLHMTQYQGEWRLRIPGGSLTPSAADIKRAKEAASAPTPAVAAAPAPAARVAPPAPQAAAPVAPPPPVVAAAPRVEPPPPASKAEPAARADAKKADAKKAPEKAAPPPVRTTYDNWVRVCPTARSPRKECFIEAVLANSADKQPILRWRLVRNEDGSASSIVVTPSAVTVAAGFEMGLAKEKPTAIPYRVCTPQACELRFNMEPALVETVSGKTVVPAKFINAAGATVQFDIPMKGFRQAMNSLK